VRAKWFDSRSCPVIVNVITLESMLDEFWKIRFDDGPPLAHYFRCDYD